MLRSPTPKNITSIYRHDKRYPVRLNDLYDPPGVLYIDGNIDLLTKPMIAVVGSRNASLRGMNNASLFTKMLSQAGFVVLSGLARGVDGAAHQAALSLEDGLTVAICGTGVDIVYPKEHFKLASAIRQRGLLVSEFSPGTGPKPHHFPKRNRLIAALALGVVVIEAADRSGSLITACIAAELGREVFALPGAIDNPLHRGCNRLIQEGAKLVNSPNEVLEEFAILAKNPI